MPALPAKRFGPLGLGLLIVLVLGVHAWMLGSYPNPRLWGDEPMYVQNAASDALLGETSLLPGNLPFRTRPEFSARLYSNFEQGPGLLRSVSLLHMLLLALTLAMLYGQARLLGLRPAFALLASALLGAFPWFGFHVHSLWPEVLHAFFVAAAVLGILAAMQRGRLLYLLPAGISLALALFTKGVMQPFVFLFAGLLAVRFWQRARAAGQGRAWVPALLAPLVLLGSTYAVLAPQLIANHQAGHGARIAANRWWNLELGLCAEPREGRSVGSLQTAYFAASPDDAERERLARERTLKFVAEVGPWKLVRGQWSKFQRLLFQHESSMERSLGKMQRWGPEPPALLSGLAGLGRGMWYALFSLGGIGALLLWRRDSGWFLISSFSLAFLLAAFLVPLKVRFLLPLIPFLCLLSAGALQLLWTRLRSKEVAQEPPASLPH